MVRTLYPDGDVRTAVAEVVDPGEFEIDVELIILVPYGIVGRSSSGCGRRSISGRAQERSLMGTPAVAGNAIAISCEQQIFDSAGLCRERGCERAGLINAKHGEGCGKRPCRGRVSGYDGGRENMPGGGRRPRVD